MAGKLVPCDKCMVVIKRAYHDSEERLGKDATPTDIHTGIVMSLTLGGKEYHTHPRCFAQLMQSGIAYGGYE